MQTNKPAKPVNALELLSQPTPTLTDKAMSLYATLPYHFNVYYQSGYGPTLDKARLEKAKYISNNGIPWTHVEYIAQDLLAKGKLTRAGVDAAKLAEELTKIRTLARRLDTSYDTEA